jgi:hypothetical protein
MQVDKASKLLYPSNRYLQQSGCQERNESYNQYYKLRPLERPHVQEGTNRKTMGGLEKSGVCVYLQSSGAASSPCAYTRHSVCSPSGHGSAGSKQNNPKQEQLSSLTNSHTAESKNRDAERGKEG